MNGLFKIKNVFYYNEVYGKFDSKNLEISCKTSLLIFSGMMARNGLVRILARYFTFRFN